MSTTYTLRVYQFSDYDLQDWIWLCASCNRKVGQKLEHDISTLTCWKCGYLLKVHSKHSRAGEITDNQEHKWDIPWDFVVELADAPTKADLLFDRDKGIEVRWVKVKEAVHNTKILWKSQPMPNQENLTPLIEHTEKMMAALKEVKVAVGHYETYKAEWAKRGIE